MLKWITSNPLYAGIILVVLLAIIFGGFKLVESRMDKADETLVNLGATTERGRANEEVINSVQNATDARDRPNPELDNRVCDEFDRNC
jgi:hypothetical protein